MSTLRQFVSDARSSIAMFDRDMTCLAASPAWRANYGLTDDIVGQRYYELLGDQIPDDWKAVHQRGILGEAISGRSQPLLRRDGRIQYLNWDIAPWRSDDGEIGGITIWSEDVTEREVMRQTLQDTEARMQSQNWALAAYSRSIAALLHARSTEKFTESVCDAIVAGDIYILAAIGLLEPPPSKKIRFVAAAGRAKGYLDGLNLSWDESDVVGQGPAGLAIRSGAPFIMRDGLIEPSFEAWREKAAPFGIRSSVTIPFLERDLPKGILLVYASSPNAFGTLELDLFRQLADELAFSIEMEAESARQEVTLHAKDVAEVMAASAIEQLRASEANYRVLAENIKDVIFKVNMDGIIEYVSPSISYFTGLKPDSWIGRHVNETVVSEKQINYFEYFEQNRPLPHGIDNEFQFRRADGSLGWAQGSPTFIQDDDGNPIGLMSVIRDVTDRRAVEEELRQKTIEAEAANVAKSQFLANMSHEIRTPLTGVLGFAGRLGALPDLPERARTYIDRIATSGTTLLSVVNDILDFSKLESDRVQLDPHPFDPVEMFTETVELVGLDAWGKGLALTCVVEGEPPATVLADSMRVRQVLLNLLSNAIKFTEAGRVEVAVSYRPEAGGELHVAVTDSGIGIPADRVDRLFQRFSQVDGSNTRAYGGAGLGLAISKSLVELMGGRIGVESREGDGSTFWFTIAAPPCERP